MHLSRLILNNAQPNHQVLRDLASPYEMHRSIMRAFPSAADGGPGRVLFRLEPSGPDESPVILVQSEKPPEWSALQALPGYLLRADAKKLDLQLRPGQRLRFRLRANPTVRRSDDGKRMGLLREEEQRQWLLRKAASCGFNVIDCAVRSARTLTSRGKAGTQTHLAVDYEGLLEVVDPATLAQAVADGIGPAKGFGFGLLSLARA